MSTGTSPLPTARAQMDALRQAANEATVAQNMPKVLQLQAERIAELEDKLARCNAHLSNCQDGSNYIGMENEELKAQVAALRAVAVAVDNFDKWLESKQPGKSCLWRDVQSGLAKARAAGYLPAGEGTP